MIKHRINLTNVSARYNRGLGTRNLRATLTFPATVDRVD